MSDDTNNQKPDGSPASPDSEELVALKKKLAELESAVEAEKARKADAIAERDKEREKRKKEAESKAAYDEAKKLIEEQLAEKQKKIDELQGYEQSHTKWTNYEKQRRAALLAQLPEDRRAKFESSDIELLEEVVALLPTAKGPGQVPGRGGGAPASEKAWGEMTAAERAELSEKDPALAMRKLKESRKQ